jgi:hypothetical protein
LPNLIDHEAYLKSKLALGATILAAFFVSWQIMLVLGFTFKLPRTIWVLIDAQAISSLVLEASFALSVSLLVGRLAYFVVYFVISALHSSLFLVAKLLRELLPLRRLICFFIIFFRYFKKILRKNRYFLWLIASTMVFSLVYFGSLVPIFSLTALAIIMTYIIIISESRLFPIWGIEAQVKKMAKQYSPLRSFWVFFVCGVFVGSAMGFFSGQHKFKMRAEYVEYIDFVDDLSAFIVGEGGVKDRCSLSILLQTRTGFLLVVKKNLMAKLI